MQKKPHANGKPGEFTFTAHLPEGKDAISTLNAKSGGSCDHASTPTPYQGCHLAQYLMATCFQDDLVLGDKGKGLDVTTRITRMINNQDYWDKEP